MSSPSVASHLLKLEGLRKDVRGVAGKQVKAVGLLRAMREFVEQYFAGVRPTVSNIAECDPVDAEMRALLELSHKKPTVAKVLETMRRAKAGLIKLDTAAVQSSADSDMNGARDVRDEAILITLRALLPSAAMSYEQALIDLQSDSRLSWRGPSTDLREALRETLDYLAPDKDVEKAPGFKRLKDARGPTMKQKVRYILANRGVGKSRSGPAEESTDAIDEAVGSFVRSVYTRSSVSAHTPTERHEVTRILDYVRVVLCELLEIDA